VLTFTKFDENEMDSYRFVFERVLIVRLYLVQRQKSAHSIRRVVTEIAHFTVSRVAVMMVITVVMMIHTQMRVVTGFVVVVDSRATAATVKEEMFVGRQGRVEEEICEMRRAGLVRASQAVTDLLLLLLHRAVQRNRHTSPRRCAIRQIGNIRRHFAIIIFILQL
jgi:hypothetical protein